MNRLAEVLAFLLVPPVGVGVAKLTLDRRRIDVATILERESAALISGTVQSGIDHLRVLDVSLGYMSSLSQGGFRCDASKGAEQRLGR